MLPEDMLTPPVDSPYALVGGLLFDARMKEVKTGLAVQIDGHRILDVCEPAALPENITRIDLTGHTILPGLIDVHVHSEDWHAPLYLANGITTARDVGCELESVLARRARWNEPDAPAPRLLCTGPMLDGPGNTWRPSTRLVQTPQEARAQVDYLVERGVDQIKAYAFLEWPCFAAIVEQARRRGKFVVAHLGKQTNARQAIEAGLDEIEHLSGVSEAMWWERNQSSATWDWVQLWAAIDAERMARLIDLMLERGTWLAITRLVWLRIATIWDPRHQAHPQLQYLPAPLLAWWDTRFPKNSQATPVPKGMLPPNRFDRSQQVAGMAIFTAEAIRRGCKILIGTDTPFPHLGPGFSFHDEIWALLECGLSEAAALQAATLSGAQALEIDHLVGSIEPGKLADLLIVTGNPLADMRALQQIAAVLKEGRWYNPADLLAQAASYAKNAQPLPARRFDADY